jgi:hypothetical protein
MAIRLPHETKGGVFAEGETHMQLIEHLRLATEACYMIGHYKKANGEELLGQGYLAIGQMLELMVKNVTNLATKGRLR